MAQPKGEAQEVMEITLTALIKKLEIKSLVSLDKVARLTIDFSAEDNEIVNKVNQLMKADQEVTITIKDEEFDPLRYTVKEKRNEAGKIPTG